MDRRKSAAAVRPWVPATPTMCSPSDGSPASAWQSRAYAALVSATTTWSRPASGQGRSTTTPAAPRSSACLTNACPSCRGPRTATKTWPGSSLRLSAVQPETSQSGHPPKWAPGSRRRRLTEGIPRCGSRSTNQRTIGSRLHASRDPPAIPMPGRLAVHRQAAAFLAKPRKKAMPDFAPRPISSESAAYADELWDRGVVTNPAGRASGIETRVRVQVGQRWVNSG